MTVTTVPPKTESLDTASLDKPTRTVLSKMVIHCRRLLVADVKEQLQRVYGLQPDGSRLAPGLMMHLTSQQRHVLGELHVWQDHLVAREVDSHHDEGETAAAEMAREQYRLAFERLSLELAFTIFNRLAALRMCEQRGLLLECVRQGTNSEGFRLYEALAGTGLGPRARVYEIFLARMFDEMAVDLGVLFDRRIPQSLFFPLERCLEQVLQALTGPELEAIWSQDETIGWIYQFFNPDEERRAMREQAPTPESSRELAVRNQFFTPRYVVAFLTDNTLGRTWYEMRGGHTLLATRCQYRVPDSQDENSRPITRALKDPRDLKVLDPACGSGHFLLYAFDLLEVIYEEAWEDDTLPPSEVTRSRLRDDFTDLDALRVATPGLILRHNLFGIDIDPRAAQIAALALWLRAQRRFQQLNLKAGQRPPIRRSNLACAEPMPGELLSRKQLSAGLKLPVLARMVEELWTHMRLAGELGSLLRIDTTIDAVVAQYHLEYRQAKVEDRALLPERFWETARERILEALEALAITSLKTDQRLFADDATRGLAFVEVCRQRFDVVLMNPPFGSGSRRTLTVLKKTFPYSGHDLYAAFVERGLELLLPGGTLGALTSRTGFFLSSFEDWREKILLGKGQFRLMADLGHGVLDAMVETAAYVVDRPVGKNAVELPAMFFRAVRANDASSALCDAIKYLKPKIQADVQTIPVYLVIPSEFRGIPRCPFAYWVGDNIRKLFSVLPVFESHGREARRGASTGDDTRRVRCWWEVKPSRIGRSNRWAQLAKGGTYSPFYADFHLVVGWDSQRRTFEGFYGRPGRLTERPEALEYYFRPGITWPRRTSSNFSARVLPADCVFADKGPSAFVTGNESRELLAYLALLNSAPFFGLASLQLAAADAAARSYEVGIVQRTPIPTLNAGQCDSLSALSFHAWSLGRGVDSIDEVSHAFTLPALLRCSDTLSQRIKKTVSLRQQIAHELASIHRRIDEICVPLYALDAEDMRTLEEIKEETRSTGEEDEAGSPEDPNTTVQAIKSLLSYTIGVAFGRFDIRLATGERPLPAEPDPFAALPRSSPGMLQDEQGMPLIEPPPAYPVPINTTGIMVEDEGLEPGVSTPPPHDLVVRVREIFRVLFGEQAEDMERDACVLLGVRDLREYFRRPAQFFASHLQTYSRSRRQAPIYWPLSTASGSFTLWIYAPRLNAETLHLAISRYVLPRIVETQHHLDRQEADYVAGRLTGVMRERHQAARSLLGELYDLRQTLDEVTELPYQPELDDGILICAAPLRRLFRLPRWQRDLEDCWKRIEKGEFDWSHMAMARYPDRVRKKCRTDRSLAMAHNLEALYEPLVDTRAPKARQEKTPRGKKAGLQSSLFEGLSAGGGKGNSTAKPPSAPPATAPTMPDPKRLDPIQEEMPPVTQPGIDASQESCVIEEVRLKNYRAFEDARLPLAPLTVLIGRNGAGKSTVLDVLEFFREALSDSLVNALERRGGLTGLCRRSVPGPELPHIELAVVLRVGSTSPIRVLYGVVLGWDANGILKVLKELLYDETRQLNAFDRQEGNVTFKGLTPLVPSDGLLLPHISSQDPLFRVVLQTLKGIGAYSISPEAMRREPDISSVSRLEHNGSNIADILKSLAAFPDVLKWIQAYLVGITPGIVDVEIVPDGRRRRLRFRQRITGQHIAAYDVHQISDGTLRGLGMLVALRQQPAPGLICLDEPEDSMHPLALAALVSAAEESSERFPVLLTSHNTDLLDKQMIHGDAVRVIEWEDGISRIYPLREPVLARLNKPNTIESVGRLMRVNALFKADNPYVNGDGIFRL